MVDVVSEGYSNLFTLQKEDLMNTLEDYPDEWKIIKKLTRCNSETVGLYLFGLSVFRIVVF